MKKSRRARNEDKYSPNMGLSRRDFTPQNLITHQYSRRKTVRISLSITWGRRTKIWNIWAIRRRVDRQPASYIRQDHSTNMRCCLVGKSNLLSIIAKVPLTKDGTILNTSQTRKIQSPHMRQNVRLRNNVRRERPK